MEPTKDKLSDTGKELAAVAHEMRDEVTGAIDEAREQGRRDALWDKMGVELGFDSDSVDETSFNPGTNSFRATPTT
jgi:hypothetical protein